MSSLLPSFGKKQHQVRRGDEEGGYQLAPSSDFERFAQTFFGNWSSLSNVMRTMDSEFTPSLDIHETDKQFELTAELPGVDEKDIKVTLTNDALTISGEKKYEKEENREGMRSVERRYGSFVRSMPLPPNVDTEKVEATFKNGVLAITLPKTADYQKNVRSIPIRSQTNGNGHKSK